MRAVAGFDDQGNPVVREVTAAEETNLLSLISKTRTAIQTNIDALALPDPTDANNTYLAIVTPTNANVVAQVRALTNQSNAVIAQLRAITRQNTALLRMLLGVVDSTNGT